MEQLRPDRIPGPETTFREILSDRRAWTDGAITPLIFLGSNWVLGLRPAALAAATWGVGLAVYRLARRQKVNYALGGLIGLGIALLIALRTGRASTFFIPSVVFGAIYGLIAFGSVLAGRPLSAWLVRMVDQKPVEWYRQPVVRSTHMVVTGAWSVFLTGRAGIRYYLISTDSEAGLAVTLVTLGLPATALMAVASWAFIRKRLSSLPPPEPAPGREAEAPG